MQSQWSERATAILIHFICAEASKLLLWHHGIYNLLIYAVEHSLDSFSAATTASVSSREENEMLLINFDEARRAGIWRTNGFIVVFIIIPTN